MANEKHEAPRIGWGLSPALLLGYYFVLSALTGNAVAASEPIKALLRARGVFGDQVHEVQEDMLIGVTSAGVASSIIGALFGGLLNDVVGPRSTAVLGQLTSAAGFLLMFFSPPDSYALIMLGLCFLGLTYSCVSISHTSVASLFPGNATLAITVLCVGNDVSLGMPLMLSAISSWTGTSIQVPVIGYVALNLVLAVLEFFLVPNSAFSAESLLPPGTQRLMDSVSEEEEAAPPVARIDEEELADDDHISKAHVFTQMSTFHYWGLTLMTAFNFFRKLQYSQLIGQITEQVAKSSGAGVEAAAPVIMWHKIILPGTMLAAFLIGAFTNHFGVYPGMFVVNTFGVLLCLATSFSVMWLQWCAIVLYDLFSGFIFGLMYAYLGGFFGFETMGVLQAPVKLVCGGCAAIFPSWNTYVVAKLPNVLWSNRILLVMGILFYLLPIAMVLLPLGGKKANQKKALDGGVRRSKLGLPTDEARERVRFSVSLTSAEYDPAAFRALSTQSQSSARHRRHEQPTETSPLNNRKILV